jgi:hypothetical protein
MLKTLLAASALTLLCASSSVNAVEAPKVGDVAPEIQVGGWFNSIGRAPTLAELRGKTVLIEFWATW